MGGGQIQVLEVLNDQENIVIDIFKIKEMFGILNLFFIDSTM